MGCSAMDYGHCTVTEVQFKEDDLRNLSSLCPPQHECLPRSHKR